MKVIQAALTLLVAVAVTAGAQGDEVRQKGKGKRQAKAPSATQRLVADLDLTAEQKEKVAAIDKKFAGKLTELQKKETALLTADQKKARTEVQKANREAKKTGAEARKAVDAALKLTEEQKTQMAEIRKARLAVTTEVRAALKDVLTAEQLEKLPKPARAGAGKGRKKPAGADK